MARTRGEPKPSPVENIRTDVKELVEPRTAMHIFSRVEARLQGRAVHKSPVPSLLDQLRASLSPGADADASLTGGYESRPSLRSDTLDVLLRIEVGSVWWVRRLGVSVRDSPEGNLRALVGAATVCGPGDLRDLEGDVGRWWSLARTITGWDSPPWRPDVACPLCGKRGGLRVRLESKTAMCAHCGEAWAPEQIGLLAEHVRLVTEGRGDRAGMRGA